MALFNHCFNILIFSIEMHYFHGSNGSNTEIIEQAGRKLRDIHIAFYLKTKHKNTHPPQSRVSNGYSHLLKQEGVHATPPTSVFE